MKEQKNPYFSIFVMNFYFLFFFFLMATLGTYQRGMLVSFVVMNCWHLLWKLTIIFDVNKANCNDVILSC
jgi:hypothetical protein